MAEIEIFPDKNALIRAEAERVVTLTSAAIAAQGRCLIALSGGSTPKPVYELLASKPHAARIDWARVHVFWGDERCVPPDHLDSNYRMTREALLDRVPIPAENVHRIHGEDEPHGAAAAYQRELERFFEPGATPARSFDVVLLGMGADGHTASIFPGSAAVTEANRWTLAVHVQQPREMWRVTVTAPVLNAAADVTFLVAGADKAARLQQVLWDDAESRPPLPAQLINPTHGTLHWMVDAAAAGSLPAAPA